MKSEKPTYSETGGGHIGLCWPLCWQATYPCANIKIFKDKIIFSVWPIKKTIYLKDIESYSRANTIFGQGIQIKHKNSGFPYLAFWSFNAGKLTAVLQKFKIKQAPPSGALLGFIWTIKIVIALFLIGLISIIISYGKDMRI